MIERILYVIGFAFSQISIPKRLPYHAYFNSAAHANALRLREGQEAVPLLSRKECALGIAHHRQATEHFGNVQREYSKTARWGGHRTDKGDSSFLASWSFILALDIHLCHKCFYLSIFKPSINCSSNVNVLGKTPRFKTCALIYLSAWLSK